MVALFRSDESQQRPFWSLRPPCTQETEIDAPAKQQMSTDHQPGYLVSTAWLQSHLDNPDVRILDCTTYMTPQPVGPSRIDSGRADWAKGHIPGAQHVDMVNDLSDPHGRFPYTLPSDTRIAALMSRLGIGNGHRVVLYGARHPMVVTRAWWVLSTLGHNGVMILDGGFEAWQREGRPLSTEEPHFGAGSFRPKRHANRVADANDVAKALSQFNGTGGAHYGRPGRIPGSLNLPAASLIDPATGCWRSRAELEKLAHDAGLGEADDPVIVYCGGGIAATATCFALQLIGRTRVAVYDNSLLEWSADPTRPMQCDAS
jgi:thiosulfate/3-mercaptopyruvate sulfurtransferase